MKNYDASQLSVLKGLDAVRKNPGMFIGSLSTGYYHLLWEVVDNSVDEAMAGYCNEINITIKKDGETFVVEDNGRGIPVDKHPIEKISGLTLAMCHLHAGAKFQEAGGSYQSSGGMHGVGVSCVNALSDSMSVEVKRDGIIWRQDYALGNPTTKVQQIGTCKKSETGTKSTWHPDKGMFKSFKIDDQLIVRRFREMAFLNRNLRINYINHATKIEESFCYSGGIADYVKYLCQGKSNLYPIEVIQGEDKIDLTSRPGQCVVQMALLYSEEDDESIFSFCNNIITPDGGTHVSGFKTAITRVVNTLSKQYKLTKESLPNLNGDDIREGLTAVISVKFPRPEFISQTKTKLGTTEIETVVSNVVGNILTVYFDKNLGVLKKIVERAVLAQEARLAAKKQSELVKKIGRQGFLSKYNRLPGKLYDCNTERMEISELFVVEGDSACGGGKDGRDSNTQAIMPVKGKVINAEKHDLHKLLNNEEIMSLIVAIGTGIKDDFDISKLRYGKIIIMSDADTDGNHIATLLLTFFYRYMRPLIKNGHVYLAQPPLFCVEHNKEREYCWSAEEMQALVKKLGTCRVVRFKGLGEMNAEQLAETTMDPATRRLIRIQISDQADTEHMVSVLMGSDAQLRKDHIVNQVNSVVWQ